MSNESEGMNATVKTLLFVAVMAVVLGLFFYLSSLDRPPNMPAGLTHTLRINTQAKLIGLGPEKVDPRTGKPEGDTTAGDYDEKKVEQRVNVTCQQCHGIPAQDNSKHPCQIRTGKCVPVKHPPKLTCIKCHRQKHPGKPPESGEKVINMPLFEMVTMDAEGHFKGVPKTAKPAVVPPVPAVPAPPSVDGGIASTDGGVAKAVPAKPEGSAAPAPKAIDEAAKSPAPAAPPAKVPAASPAKAPAPAAAPPAKAAQ